MAYESSMAEMAVVVLEWALTWWIQIAVLAVAGCVVGAGLRRQGPAVQSTIYRVTLLALFTCPLVMPLTLWMGLSVLTIDLRPEFFAATARSDRLRSGQPVIRENGITGESIAWPSITDPDGRDAPVRMQSVSSPPRGELAEGNLWERDDHVEENAAPRILSIQSIRVLAWSVISFWIAGTLFLGGRLARDIWYAERLKWLAVPADQALVEACRDVAARLQVREPAVFMTPFLESPCLIGHWQPTILISETMESRSYECILLHEMAHLRRGDWCWSLAGRLAHVLFWLQPAVKWIERRNALVAEEVCDDFVLAYGGNRDGYARQLVEIAEGWYAPPSVARLWIVGIRSQLGRRVQRILDTTRRFSTQTSSRFATASLAITLIVTFSVSLVRLGPTKKSRG